MARFPAPAEEIVLTHFIVSGNVERSRHFYTDVLGGEAEQWNARGAEFLTTPVNNGREIRAYIRDPDGHLIEVGQTTGPLEQHPAKHDPTRRQP